ncbi:MAG: hypothetical protein JW852_10160 [Spirochaetales bacterium]|nr:hypothetical protein [Spirochaetales bacterium]
MVRKILALLFLCIPCFIFGQSVEDLNAIIDFATTLRELDQIAQSGNQDALPSKFVIIDGVVSAREVLNPDTADYVGQLNLVSGEWIGVERVVRYECILLLVGPEFASAIPARRSRSANPNEIELNTRVLAVAEAIGLYQLEDGTIVPVLQAHHIRKIQ